MTMITIGGISTRHSLPPVAKTQFCNQVTAKQIVADSSNNDNHNRMRATITIITTITGDFLELQSSDTALYVFARTLANQKPLITVFNTAQKMVTANVQFPPQFSTKCTKWQDVFTSKIVNVGCGQECLVVSVDEWQALLLVPDCD